MKSRWLVLVVAAALLASCGSGGTPAWKEFNPSGGDFSALMPGTPKQTSSDIDTDVGPIKLYAYTLDKAGIAYSVQYCDYPTSVLAAGADVLLDGAVEGMVGGGKYALVDQSTISLGQFPGREAKLSMTSGDFLIWNRVYLAGARLYQVMVVVPKADEAKSAADRARFLDSFKIVK